MQKAIGVMDSGVGGLTAVKQIQQMLPNENIIYFGDSLRMPYGNRTYQEVVEYANAIIEFLEKRSKSHCHCLQYSIIANNKAAGKSAAVRHCGIWMSRGGRGGQGRKDHWAHRNGGNGKKRHL